MHAIPPILASKQVYVPTARRPALVDKAAAPLPHALAVEPCARVFRCMAWQGAAMRPEPVQTTMVVRHPNLPAGEAFSRILWNGAAPAAPTSTQAARSVRSVFDTFKWE